MKKRKKEDETPKPKSGSKRETPKPKSGSKRATPKSGSKKGTTKS
jgi:hypothetical protein